MCVILIVYVLIFIWLLIVFRMVFFFFLSCLVCLVIKIILLYCFEVNSVVIDWLILGLELSMRRVLLGDMLIVLWVVEEE